MKTHRSWNYTPYSPLDNEKRSFNPFITSLKPGVDSLFGTYIDNGSSSGHTLFYRKRDEGEFKEIKLKSYGFEIKNLEENTDYELFIENLEGRKSETRLFRTGYVPGTVVNYLHPDDNTYSFSGNYLCSPSLIKLPSGKLLSSMDVFRGNYPQNLSLIFESDDNGETWNYVTELFPCFWGMMFYENNSLYMLGMSNEYGDLLIGKSDDEGKTWSNPSVIFRGSCCTREKGLHRAPMKIHRAFGRIWTDVEYGSWTKKEFNNAFLSAPIGDYDYTNPEIWTLSEFFMHNEYAKSYPDDLIPGACGAIEGNVISSKDGKLYNFLRYGTEKCLLLELDKNTPEGTPEFKGLIDINITASKFDIVFDDVTQLYFIIGSRRDREKNTQRNLLSLFSSEDLFNWNFVCDLIDYRDEDPKYVGFQYISFEIDGDDIIYLSRTAFNCAANFHDSNYQTFHRIKNFRRLCK